MPNGASAAAGRVKQCFGHVVSAYGRVEAMAEPRVRSGAGHHDGAGVGVDDEVVGADGDDHAVAGAPGADEGGDGGGDVGADGGDAAQDAGVGGARDGDDGGVAKQEARHGAHTHAVGEGGAVRDDAQPHVAVADEAGGAADVGVADEGQGGSIAQ